MYKFNCESIRERHNSLFSKYTLKLSYLRIKNFKKLLVCESGMRAK